MARTQSSVRMLSLVPMVIAMAFYPNVVLAEDSPEITVTIYNRSKMQASTLTAGQQVAREILHRAGVESIWIHCPVPGTPGAHAACRVPVWPKRIILTIVHHWDNRDSDALGLAVQVEHGFGSYCYVFQKRLEALSSSKHIHPARLLGHAMAHEIGHLLKGSNSHSPRGIMSARWSDDELRSVAMGSLNFTSADGLRMRSRLAEIEDKNCEGSACEDAENFAANPR